MPKLGWSVSREDFTNQMEYLSTAGYHVIPISDLSDYMSGARDSLPENPVVITVDDGFIDAYTEVAPILKRFRYPWSLYVYPKFIGVGTNALNWPQVLELNAAGVDVESHTVTHPHLMHRSHPELSDEQYRVWLRGELTESKSILERKLKKPIRFLAYPYGDYDATVEEEATNAGYLLALTSWAGLNTRTTRPMELRRFPMTSDTTIGAFANAVGAPTLVLRELAPAPDSVGSPAAIRAVIADPTQFDPTTVRLALLGESGRTSTYNPKTGEATLKTPALKRKRQTVVLYALRAADRQPTAAAWTFYTTETAKAQYEDLARTLRELPLHHTQTKRQ